MTRRSNRASGVLIELIGFIVIGIGLMTAAATIMGFFGRTYWILDIVANLRPQMIITLVICAVIWRLIFRANQAWILLAFALVNAVVIAPLFLGSQHAAAAGSPKVSVISFNVSAGNPNRTEAVEWMTSQDADLIFIFESSKDWESTIRVINTGYEVVISPPDDRIFGPTVLAKPELPVTADLLRVGLVEDPVARVTVGQGESAITFFGVHPRAPRTSASAGARDDVMLAVVDIVNRIAGPVVMVGDFNATPWSWIFRRTIQLTDLNDSLRGRGLQPTWPAGAGMFGIPIDHVLTSDELTTTSRETGPALGSAHRALLVTIEYAAD